MKNGLFKKLTIICLCMSILFTACSGDLKNRQDYMKLGELIFSVCSVNGEDVEQVGKYMLSFESDKEYDYVTEKKDYIIMIASEEKNVLNIKKYKYENGELLENEIQEIYDDEIKYNASYIIEKEKDYITLLSSVNNQEAKSYFPNTSIRLSFNSSEIFVKMQNDLPNVGDIWFTYDFSGYIDRYECILEEKIENENFGLVDCIKVCQSGLFETNYWISRDGIIIRIEQVMSPEYSLCMNLISYSR